MRFRKLRIAFSATCLIACVLLIALWVRSYSRVDSVNGVLYSDVQFDLSSLSGCTLAEVWGGTPLSLPQYDTYRNTESDFSSPAFIIVGRSEQPGGSGFVVISPYWFSLVFTIALAALPWLPWRFRFRILLIVTTLVAVVLGLTVYAARQ